MAILSPSLRFGVGGCARARPDPGPTYLGVDNFVSAERAGLAKTFATDFAHERSGTGVDRHVAGEVIVSVKHLWKDKRGLCAEFHRGPRTNPRRPQPTFPQPTPQFRNQSPLAKCFPICFHQYRVTADSGIPILQNRKLRPSQAPNLSTQLLESSSTGERGVQGCPREAASAGRPSRPPRTLGLTLPHTSQVKFLGLPSAEPPGNLL